MIEVPRMQTLDANPSVRWLAYIRAIRLSQGPRVILAAYDPGFSRHQHLCVCTMDGQPVHYITRTRSSSVHWLELRL